MTAFQFMLKTLSLKKFKLVCLFKLTLVHIRSCVCLTLSCNRNKTSSNCSSVQRISMKWWSTIKSFKKNKQKNITSREKKSPETISVIPEVVFSVHGPIIKDRILSSLNDLVPENHLIDLEIQIVIMWRKKIIYECIFYYRLVPYITNLILGRGGWSSCKNYTKRELVPLL